MGAYGGQAAEVLQNALVRHVDDGVCGSSSYYGAQFNNATMFCAGDEKTDSCTYDSGGPAVILKHRNDILLASAKPGQEAIKAPKSAVLAGITSWGHGCAKQQKPGVYVRLSSFLSWIESTLATLSASSNDTRCGAFDHFLTKDIDARPTVHCSSQESRCWFQCS